MFIRQIILKQRCWSVTGKVITINNEQDLEFYKAVLDTEDLVLGDRVTRLVHNGQAIYDKVLVSEDSGLDALLCARLNLERGDMFKKLVNL